MFLLPAKSGEKVSLGVNVLVSFSLFLIIVAERVPDTSDAVPVIGMFINCFKKKKNGYETQHIKLLYTYIIKL